MSSKGSNVLDEVLQFGKLVGDLRGIRFNYQSLNKQGEISMPNSILPKRDPKPVMSKHLIQDHIRHQNSQTKGKLLHWILSLL